MTNDEVTKLKRDYAKRAIEFWVDALIKKQDTLLFLHCEQSRSG